MKDFVMPDSNKNFKNGFVAYSMRKGDESGSLVKWGLMDTQYRVSVVAKYDKLDYAFENNWCCCLNGKWGLINTNGDIIIPLIYSGLTYCKTPNKYNGKPLFFAALKFRDNKEKYVSSEFLTRNKWGEFGQMGVIDIDNKKVIPLNFQCIDIYNVDADNSFFYNMATAISPISGLSDDITTRVFNLQGQLIINDSVEEIEIYASKLGMVYLIGIQNKNYGIYDYKGNVKVDYDYDYLQVISDNAIIVGKGNKDCRLYCYTDNDGNNFYSTIKYAGKFGMINFEGQVLIPVIYSKIIPFNSSFYFCSKLGRWKATGEICEYTSDNWGIIDNNGKSIVPMDYTAPDIKKIASKLPK